MSAERLSLRGLARRLEVDPAAVRRGVRTGRLSASVGREGGRPFIADSALAAQEWRANATRAALRPETFPEAAPVMVIDLEPWNAMVAAFDTYVADMRALLTALPDMLGGRLHRAAKRGGRAGVERELRAAMDEVLTLMAPTEEGGP